MALRIWSTGAHSPFWHMVSKRCAASLAVAPALWGFDEAPEDSSPAALPLVSAVSSPALSPVVPFVPFAIHNCAIIIINPNESCLSIEEVNQGLTI
nr:unnamed protein product [Callosobruchus chinensis]